MWQILQEVSRNIWVISIWFFLFVIAGGTLIYRLKFWPRWSILLFAGLAPIGILLVLGSCGVPLFPLLLEWMLGEGVALEGKDLVQSLLLLCSVPAFYFLWLWRDQNMQHTIQNQRKDTNLKDFQETQRRAAGQIDDMKDNPEAARALQIAALHQLRPFLKGEHGESFRRPAFEMYRALLDIHGTKAYGEVMEYLEKVRETGEYAEFLWMFESTLRTVIHSPIYKELLKIIQEDPHAFFHKDFPLAGLALPGINLSEVRLDGMNLQGANLIGAKLSSASLERVILRNAHLEGADLKGANLERADLKDANLENAEFQKARLIGAELQLARFTGAYLVEAHLEDADLKNANLENTYLWSAHLGGADLRGTTLKGAILLGATYNDRTMLDHANYDDSTYFGYWNDETQSIERGDEHREALRALGLMHVDEFRWEEATYKPRPPTPTLPLKFHPARQAAWGPGRGEGE